MTVPIGGLAWGTLRILYGCSRGTQGALKGAFGVCFYAMHCCTRLYSGARDRHLRVWRRTLRGSEEAWGPRAVLAGTKEYSRSSRVSITRPEGVLGSTQEYPLGTSWPVGVLGIHRREGPCTAPALQPGCDGVCDAATPTPAPTTSTPTFAPTAPPTTPAPTTMGPTTLEPSGAPAHAHCCTGVLSLMQPPPPPPPHTHRSARG